MVVENLFEVLKESASIAGFSREGKPVSSESTTNDQFAFINGVMQNMTVFILIA